MLQINEPHSPGQTHTLIFIFICLSHGNCKYLRMSKTLLINGHWAQPCQVGIESSANSRQHQPSPQTPSHSPVEGSQRTKSTPYGPSYSYNHFFSSLWYMRDHGSTLELLRDLHSQDQSPVSPECVTTPPQWVDSMGQRWCLPSRTEWVSEWTIRCKSQN